MSEVIATVADFIKRTEHFFFPAQKTTSLCPPPPPPLTSAKEGSNHRGQAKDPPPNGIDERDKLDILNI
jgi:hypothetical protein